MLIIDRFSLDGLDDIGFIVAARGIKQGIAVECPDGMIRTVWLAEAYIIGSQEAHRLGRIAEALIGAYWPHPVNWEGILLVCAEGHVYDLAECDIEYGYVC